MDTPTRDDLLDKYAARPVRHFYQVDGHLNADEVMGRDADGDAVTGGETYELRRYGVAVRIQILDGTTKADALRLLKKAVAFLERDRPAQIW